MHSLLFKKNSNQSFPKKMINKYTNILDVLCSSKHPSVNIKHDINIFGGKTLFFEKKQTKAKSDLFKICKKNNFLASLELYAFYIKYKKVTAINFRGRTYVKHFLQTYLLRFCKDTAKVSSLFSLKITTKSTHFPPAKKIRILWTELQTNKIQKV